MNNCIRITNATRVFDSEKPEFAINISQDARGNYNSVSIENKPYALSRTDMNKILANTITWKPKFKTEYHARKT